MIYIINIKTAIVKLDVDNLIKMKKNMTCILNGGYQMSSSVSPTFTNMNNEGVQYAHKVTKRHDSAISAVESAHAERTTQNELNNIATAQQKQISEIDDFEKFIADLFESEYTASYAGNAKLPDRILYKGKHVAEANGLTVQIFAEKQQIIKDAHKYINDVNVRKNILEKELSLEREKSQDFEEQLDESLKEQDDQDETMKTKDKEITELTQKVGQYELYGLPFLMLVVFYSYMCGQFGIFTVIYTHVWMIGMFFYGIGWTIQTTFQIGANTTGFVISAGQGVCGLFIPE